MPEYTFKMICGRYSGLESKGAELIAEALSQYIDYPLPIEFADNTHPENLRGCNLILIGTQSSNCLLRKLGEKGFFQQPPTAGELQPDNNAKPF